MASSYTNIQQYRDPGQVDLSSTFSAQSYKQNNYDVNTNAIQQLANKYVGTDLLRDIDKQYLGERLATLTNYVQQAGALDWSRKSVADEVGNYIGEALDQNVMAGIASTQRYRKHQMEMEELKKKNPELYAIQNDLASTIDLNRYLNSGQLGDMYQQQEYKPFTDTNKLVLEGLPKLKEFMIDVVYTDDRQPVLVKKTEEMVPGNEPNLLVKVEKHEVLSEEEAGKYMTLILGTKGMDQLAIDGMYKYRNNTSDEVRAEYKNKLTAEIENYKTASKNFDVQSAGKSDVEKAKLSALSTQASQQANRLGERLSGIDKVDKNTLASLMHANDYTSNWSKLLSFDRVVDWKYDDKNLRLAERNDSLAQKQWEKDFQEDKFKAETKWKQKNYDLDLAKALGDGNIAIEDGKPVPVIGKGGNSGVTETSNPDNLTDGEKPRDVLAEDVMENYSIAFNKAKDDTSVYVKELMSKDSGRKILQEHYGNITDKDADRLVYAMMRGTPEAQKTLNNLRGVMSKSASGALALESIKNSISAHRQKERMKPLLEDALKGVNDITRTVMKADNIDKEFYGLSGKIVGKNGNLTDGSYIGKDFDQLNTQEKLGAQIGSISNRLFAGKIDDSERSALIVLRKNLIAQVKDKTARDYYENTEAEDKTSFWDSVTSDISAIGQRARMFWNNPNPSLNPGVTLFQTLRGTGDEERQAYADAKKTYDANTANSKRYADRVDKHLKDMFNTNYTFNDLASNDLKRKGRDLSLSRSADGLYNQSADEAFKTKVTPALKILNDRLQDNNSFKLNNKTLNFNTEDKNVKAQYESWFKTQFDGEIQNNANVKVNVNSKDNTVTVTAPVKEGKEYEIKTSIPMSFSELPNNIRSMVSTNKDFEYDALNNKNASPLYMQGQVYSSNSRINELYGDLELTPTDKRAAIQTVREQVQNVIGNENYTKYKQEIEAIIKTPIDMEARPVNGVYVMDFKSGNKLIDKQVMGTNISDRIDLIADQKDKLSVEKIIQYIQKTYNK